MPRLSWTIRLEFFAHRSLWVPSRTVLLLSLVLTSCAFLHGCGEGLPSEPPLHDAAFRGDADKVRDLLKSGVGVNSVNSEGATALHWAAFKGHLEVAKVLIQHGAQVNAKTKKGSTPLRLAKTHQQEDLIAFLTLRGAKE